MSVCVCQTNRTSNIKKHMSCIESRRCRRRRRRRRCGVPKLERDRARQPAVSLPPPAGRRSVVGRRRMLQRRIRRCVLLDDDKASTVVVAVAAVARPTRRRRGRHARRPGLVVRPRPRCERRGVRFRCYHHLDIIFWGEGVYKEAVLARHWQKNAELARGSFMFASGSLRTSFRRLVTRKTFECCKLLIDTMVNDMKGEAWSVLA